ncbi:MAG: hypothetical protein Q7U53_01840 [Anaerolineaceae bacterium]|nr:hypothetical protein [Anaerolineaceae bacterium]
MQRNKRKWGLLILLGIIGFCLLSIVILLIVNIFLPKSSTITNQLGEMDMVRILEAQHLRENLGDQVFPGLQSVDIPVLLFNEENAFLTGMQNPDDGWVKVPQEQQRGGAWQLIPAMEEFPEQPYYRSAYDTNSEPDAFTVRVGETYVSSLPTYEWFRIDLMNHFRSDLPGFVKSFFPYSLVTGIFMLNSDTYLSMIQHESFHAFQAVWAQPRFEQAERDGIQLGDQYPWENQESIDAWKVELDLLQSALKAEDKEAARQLVQQFLDQREARRIQIKLSPDLIRYETQREWIEGMARYAELETWRIAANDPKYQPIPEMKSDHKFKDYRTFEQRWKRELDQIVRMADDEGDGRFYYSGMAQAYLLDRLHPSWKLTLGADPMLNLEDLLEQSLGVDNLNLLP